MLTLTFADTGTPTPRGGRKVNEWVDGAGRVCAQAFSRPDKQWIDFPGVGVFAFSADSLEVWAWPEPDARREEIGDTFYSELQPIVMQALGWQALHASAVAGTEGVIAFCGKSGSGKSTLAFAMQRLGWPQVADDAVVLQPNQNNVSVCPVPFKARLRPASRAHFAEIHGPRACSVEVQQRALTAIVILQQNRSNTGPRISLIPQERAFTELLAHAHCFDENDLTHTRRMVEFYLELIARVRVFSVEYRPNFQELTQLIHSITDVIYAQVPFSSELRAAALVTA